MPMEIADAPRADDEAFVIAQTRQFNAAFADNDVRSVFVFARADAGYILDSAFL